MSSKQQTIEIINNGRSVWRLMLPDGTRFILGDREDRQIPAGEPGSPVQHLTVDEWKALDAVHGPFLAGLVASNELTIRGATPTAKAA